MPCCWQAVVELRVHHAVLAFLAREIPHFLISCGSVICSLKSRTQTMKNFSLPKQGRQGVEETRLERIAAEPVLGNVAVESEVELSRGTMAGDCCMVCCIFSSFSRDCP